MIKGMENALREIERERQIEQIKNFVSGIQDMADLEVIKGAFQDMTEIKIIKDAIQRIADGEEVSKISNELGYGITQKQLNYLIYCYLNGDYRQEIGDFLTDINFHSGLTQIEEFAAFIDDYMA